MLKLQAQLQNYPWGDTGSIAALQRRTPTGQPEAEAWFGAHPNAPSATAIGPLDAVIAADPGGMLGEATAQRFEGRLPYLVKLLAARQPLSIQAHPSIAQAREGFARENEAGIPLTAPHRNYKDANHKPEILVALTPFRAMAGFRPVSDTVALLDAFALEELSGLPAVGETQTGESAWLRAVLEFWLALEDPARTVDAVVDRARELANGDGLVADTARNIVFIGEEFPGDVGVLASLVLNHVELAPGDALYLPAGNMHAYISGFGVEVMANSDNVLRGGLTSKHIDRAELFSVVEFNTLADPRFTPEVESRGGFTVHTFDVGIPDFAVTRFDADSRASTTLKAGLPTITLCAAGALTLTPDNDNASPAELGPGEAVFIAANEGEVRVTEAGDSGAQFFAITPGDVTAAG